ncbi:MULTISPECIES: hypothetical protein [unclassified Agrococcus]|uniref:hypothetical protein n=1 Tax=unclassified Agrococcus TaxID=2615065 RepID=UPI00362065C4
MECDFEIASQGHASMHMAESLAIAVVDRRSHTIRVTNPTREQRIADFIGDLEREAVSEAVDEICEAIDDGLLTEAEALAVSYRNELLREDLKEALR